MHALVDTQAGPIRELFAEEPVLHPGLIVVAVPKSAQIGWVKIGGKWQAAPPPPVLPWRTSKARIIDRLHAAGKLIAALDAVEADRVLKARWDAASAIMSDDADFRAFMAAIGVDADAMLAP
jgi:hypothetical protein